MSIPTHQELEKKIRDLEAKLAEASIERDAHEGLLKLAMDDMRRIYEDLLRSQTQLMQSDKLATIGLLTAGIVHEINNPLAAIKLSYALLDQIVNNLDKATPPPRSSVQEGFFKDSQVFIDQGKRCVETMVKIVGDIRMFSRSDKGERHDENVNQIIESVIGIVWNSVKNKVKIQKVFSDLPKISCNAQQLSQVFLNLIVNAAQACGDVSGVITIRTSKTPSHILVQVRDTGCGMTPEVKAKIFEAFFTTKGAEQGTGLGLSITHDIIKKHNGTITVDSEPGKGTAFTVSIPLS